MRNTVLQNKYIIMLRVTGTLGRMGQLFSERWASWREMIHPNSHSYSITKPRQAFLDLWFCWWCSSLDCDVYESWNTPEQCCFFSFLTTQEDIFHLSYSITILCNAFGFVHVYEQQWLEKCLWLCLILTFTSSSSHNPISNIYCNSNDH